MVPVNEVEMSPAHLVRITSQHKKTDKYQDTAKENSAYFDSSRNLQRKPEQRKYRPYLLFYQGLKLGHEPLDSVA